ncbi:MAG: hypothetical protein RL481_300, partial [Pseudomonadota bacterium]
MKEPEVETLSTRRWTKRRIFGAVALLLLLLLAIAWFQRERFADNLIQGQLNQAGVRADYEIAQIGLRTQRLENVVLGDPKHPDLTAKVVEIDIAIGFGAPAVRAIRAEGVRLNGKLVDGMLSFGELDKFMDPNNKEPFTLPDLALALKDAQLSLGTPWGAVGVSLAGSGHLRNSFNGRLAVIAPKLDGFGCSGSDLHFNGTIRTQSRQPELNGPLVAALLSCPERGISIAGAALKGKVTLSEKLDNWVGGLGFAANSARVSGQHLNGAEGKVTVYGNMARTDFELALAKAAYRSLDLTIAKLSGDATGRLAFGQQGVSISARGDAGFTGGTYSGKALSSLSSVAKGTQRTPVGPLMAALDPALRNALRSFDGSMGFDASIGAEKGSVVDVRGLNISSKSGAQVSQIGALSLSRGTIDRPVQLSLSGGGLPDANLSLKPERRGWAGMLALAPFAKGGASLGLPKLSFASGPGGIWRFNGQAVLTGPLMGGRIEGLSLPVDGSITGSTFSMLSGCKDIRFTRFQTGSLTLPGQSFRACAEGGSILTVGGGETRLKFRAPTMAGRGGMGGSPLAFQGGNIRFDLDSGFTASNVSVDLGTSETLTKFSVANLSGSFAGTSIDGKIEGGAGTIGNVPLLIDNANGNWSWRDSILTLDSALRVSDVQQVDRFETLAVPDLQLVLANGVITALGHVHEPESGLRIADVDIKHTLSVGAGRALFAVDGLRFNDRLPIEKLTPLTLGAIANLEGSVSGDGLIEWDGGNVRSRGKFASNGLNFAAAFGPVTGLSTEVTFTDLLNLKSAPSQIARIAVVNPGIPAFEGVIAYRLLADQKVQIESGRWPFYGGELILEPTVIDFDVEKPRNLTFRLVGLDAEKFLGGYELQNLRVSGIFDGTLPMVFDQEGGKIVGGWLVSRPGGGEVSYLGQLTYEDMGYFANFAFNALKSIKFD